MNYPLRGPKPIACYLGACGDETINLQSASGGVVSQIILNHLSTGGIVITPQFDPSVLRFRITQIQRPEDYIVAASVYHDVGLVDALKAFEIDAKLSYLLTCLPCEASFAKNFFKKKGAHAIIIALACSGQQHYDATSTLFKMSGLDVCNITDFKYRGDGWPSGVQVRLNNGQVRNFPNLKGLWYNIFNSQLFTLEKCFTCTDVLGKNADIVCADPWLPEYMNHEREGVSHTLVFVRRPIDPLLFKGISLQDIDTKRAILSQKYTIDRKERQLSHKSIVYLFLRSRHYLALVLTTNSILLTSFRILYSKFWKLIP
jgi:coenzyme F420-reducing hydrogenase beta subunit